VKNKLAVNWVKNKLAAAVKFLVALVVKLVAALATFFVVLHFFVLIIFLIFLAN